MIENEVDAFSERRSVGVDDRGGLVKRFLNGSEYGSSEDCIPTGYADAEVAKNNLGHKELGNELSIEHIFDSKRVPSWWEQITLRGLLVSLAIGIIYSIIVMKLSLTTGLVPTMNVSAGLLGFVFMRTWTKFQKGAGLLKTPFTRQGSTVIQTCAVAC